MGVVSGCGLQEVGAASGWNLWVRLECIGVVNGYWCIGVVNGCCCKEVYRCPHNITYPYSTCITSFFSAASILLCSF